MANLTQNLISETEALHHKNKVLFNYHVKSYFAYQRVGMWQKADFLVFKIIAYANLLNYQLPAIFKLLNRNDLADFVPQAIQNETIETENINRFITDSVPKEPFHLTDSNDSETVSKTESENCLSLDFEGIVPVLPLNETIKINANNRFNPANNLTLDFGTPEINRFISSPKRCKNPHCQNEVKGREGKEFCTTSCRQKYHNQERRKIQNHYLQPHLSLAK